MAKRESCKIPKGLDIRVIKSRHSDALKIKIGGSVSKIAVEGETTPVYPGLDEVNQTLARKITRVFRADGSGRAVPTGARRKIEAAVLCKLLRSID